LSQVTGHNNNKNMKNVKEKIICIVTMLIKNKIKI
jgi:hypothetical protein